MAQKDILSRSLGAGRDAGQRTQEHIETLLTDMVRRSEEQAEAARRVLNDLVDRSRTTSEQVVDVVDRELRTQISNLGLATRADIERLEAKIEKLSSAPASRSTKTAARKKSTTKKATRKKASAKKRSTTTPSSSDG